MLMHGPESSKGLAGKDVSQSICIYRGGQEMC